MLSSNRFRSEFYAEDELFEDTETPHGFSAKNILSFVGIPENGYFLFRPGEKRPPHVRTEEEEYAIEMARLEARRINHDYVKPTGERTNWKGVKITKDNY